MSFTFLLNNKCIFAQDKNRIYINKIDNLWECKIKIYTDSISVITEKISNPFIIKLLNRVNSLNMDIVFCSIPSHVGTMKNDRVDSVARKASTIKKHIKPLKY